MMLRYNCYQIPALRVEKKTSLSQTAIYGNIQFNIIVQDVLDNIKNWLQVQCKGDCKGFVICLRSCDAICLRNHKYFSQSHDFLVKKYTRNSCEY